MMLPLMTTRNRDNRVVGKKLMLRHGVFSVAVGFVAGYLQQEKKGQTENGITENEDQGNSVVITTS